MSEETFNIIPNPYQRNGTDDILLKCLEDNRSLETLESKILLDILKDPNYEVDSIRIDEIFAESGIPSSMKQRQNIVNRIKETIELHGGELTRRLVYTARPARNNQE